MEDSNKQGPRNQWDQSSGEFTKTEAACPGLLCTPVEYCFMEFLIASKWVFNFYAFWCEEEDSFPLFVCFVKFCCFSFYSILWYLILLFSLRSLFLEMKNRNEIDQDWRGDEEWRKVKVQLCHSMWEKYLFSIKRASNKRSRKAKKWEGGPSAQGRWPQFTYWLLWE